jgi:hypothetical protein
MSLLARHLLLAALLLRALVPLGWMPGSVQLGQAAWIICSADGQIQHGLPGKDDAAGQHQQPCAFAAAHLLAPPPAAILAAPQLQAATLVAVTAPAALHRRAAFTPQSPRAPPVFL